MRNLLPKAFLTCCLILSLAVAAAAAADQPKEQVDVYENKKLIKSVVFQVGKDEYFINNQAPGVKMDAEPFIESSRTFVPIRYLSNALGVEDKHISWESPAVNLSQPGMPVVELAVGQKQIESNGNIKAMDVAPLLREGRTYLPARFVAEALGYQVAWDAENRLVLAYPQGEEKPDISKVMEYIGGEVQQPGTHMVGGFVIPDDTPLYKVNGNPEGGCELSIGIDVVADDFKQQLEAAKNILASKFGEENASMIIDYVSQKKNWVDDVPLKIFNINGQEIDAGSPKGDLLITIRVWEPKD